MDRHTTPPATAQRGIAPWNHGHRDTIAAYPATAFGIYEIGPALDEAVDGKKERSGYMRLNKYWQSRGGDFAIFGVLFGRSISVCTTGLKRE
jgi:hypothetical protein